ncbi:phosphatidate phosphatase PAH2 isoform X3 [Manihot esculenta]|uniref:phosphatidate phosphatase PAH2 isoform X3 n=1 Tax=Manihot esculenta TaxID=3983 RepID=UPI000B5D5969|nr:phosphatidate phosphatase PAH2 isoform X3 [Manihot esculenta]
MNTVGRLITRGVSTVSGPFHPFGGAVDIIVVEQPDGSFKSSPWYVRFGKFQGVLKAREKVVYISVNGTDANFHMYLDPRGEAYFLREVQGDGAESVSSSSSDEKDEQSQNGTKPMKSNTCDFDGNTSDKINGNNGKIVARTNSRQSRIFGLVFGRRSKKEGGYQDGINNDGAGMVRISSLDRAELAANLLDVKWSTKLTTSESMKDNTSQFSASDTYDGKGVRDRLTNDGQSQVGSSVQDASETSVGHHMFSEEIGSCNVQMGNSSHSGFESGKFSVQQSSVEVSGFGCTEQVVETDKLDESAPEKKLEELSSISRNISETGLHNADQYDNSVGVISDVTCSDSQIVDVYGAFPSIKSDQEWVSGKRNVALAGFGISKESGCNGIQSLIYCGKSENSPVDLDGSDEQAEETLCLTGGVRGDVNFYAETLHVKLPEDSVTLQAEEIELETIFTKSCDNDPQLANSSPPSVRGHDELNLEVKSIVPKSHTQMITMEMDPLLGLTEAESKNIRSSISSFTNSDCQFENAKNFGDKISRDELQPSLESVSGSEQLNGDCELEKAVSVPVSENSEEEQFIFSDLDDNRETQGNLNFPDGVVEENNPSFSTEDTDEENEPLSRNDELFSSEEFIFQKNQLTDIEMPMGNSKGTASPISIPNLQSTADMKVGWVGESLPNMWSCSDNTDSDVLHHPLSHSLDSDSRPLEWKLPSKDESSCINSGGEKESQSSPESSNREDSHLPEDIKDSANPAVGDQSKAIETTGGSWRLWPFTFTRSRSRKTVQPTITDAKSSDAENAASHSNIDMNYNQTVVKPEVSKRMVRTIAPTSEELVSLNLKDGSNTVTFTFSTSMLGMQKVDARIYLWKWKTRIVISDVDGTITKSDVLGQFMPLVGMDWSQTGVAPLFSAIKGPNWRPSFGPVAYWLAWNHHPAEMKMGISCFF